MTKARKIFIFILGLLGLICSIELISVYVHANFSAHPTPSFCAINQYVDCDLVARTHHSQFLGVPLACWGFLLYCFILLMIFVDKLKNIKLLSFLEVFKNPYSYISAISLLAFSISMILAFISIFDIKSICILCFVTYFIDLGIALTARDREHGFIHDFKLGFTDIIDALKIKKYAITFGVLVFLASAILTYTSVSYVFTPQVKRYNSFKYFADMKKNPFKKSGNLLGDENARIVVQTYTDYNCPGCYILNLMLHRVVTEVSGVKIVHHHLPLDGDCNPNVSKGRSEHLGSCLMAKYAIAAEKQGKFWDMNDLLFENTPKNEKEILALSKKIRLNTKELKADANSEEVKNKLLDDIKLADKYEVGGTPTFFIGMQKHLGAVPYYELKELLIKSGAKERK